MCSIGQSSIVRVTFLKGDIAKGQTEETGEIMDDMSKELEKKMLTMYRCMYPARCTETRAILHIAYPDGFLRRDWFQLWSLWFDSRMDGLRRQQSEGHVWQFSLPSWQADRSHFTLISGIASSLSRLQRRGILIAYHRILGQSRAGIYLCMIAMGII